MKLMIPAIIALAVASVAFPSCRQGRTADDISALMQCDSLPKEVKSLVKTVADDDSADFARLVSYPLERPYPLRNIENEAQMRAAYATIVDDSLRHAIVSSSPADWQQYGWRGWTLDEGQYLWIDEKIYDIAYVSPRERRLRDSLVARDMATLYAPLRKGWTPVGCLRGTSNGTIYRLDSRRVKPGQMMYRMCVYADTADLSGRPAAILTGYKAIEGSAATTTYHFRGDDGMTCTYLADIPDNSTPQLDFTMPEGSLEVPVVNIYWLDAVNGAASRSRNSPAR